MNEMKIESDRCAPITVQLYSSIKIYNSKSAPFVNEQVAGRGAPENFY